jgi:hypothetical protein
MSVFGRQKAAWDFVFLSYAELAEASRVQWYSNRQKLALHARCFGKLSMTETRFLSILKHVPKNQR